MQEKVLQLLESKHYNELKKYLETINNADLAQLLSEFKNEDMILLYRFLSKDMAVETFAYMDTELQERLIHAMTDKELHDVTSELFLDDTIDLIEEMPANIVKRILKQAHPEQRALINEFLKYPSDSAGSLMTIEFIDLKATMTVEEAFAKIRKIGLDKETIYTCYVLDDSRRLQGIVTVKDLLLAKYDTVLTDIMETNLITVNTHDDKEEVVRKINKYDFLALPVVDQEFRLVGIITIDDAVDVMQDEITEDFERMAAIAPSEDTYFRTSVFQHAKNRITWLMVLMLSATVTGALITRYENAFQVLPILVSFIPMLMDTGGNCGSQSSTLIIRGMALDEIRSKDVFRVLFKEVRVSLLVGVILGTVNGLRIFIQYHDPLLALVVGLTLIATVCLSKALGCILPMFAKRFNLDPAIMAAPLITTIVDTCSIIIYFNIAMRILNI